MDNQRAESKALTKFSIEELLNIPKGVVREYYTPLADCQGSLKLVITDDAGIIDGTVITDRATMPLVHFNDKPFVEMNFVLDGRISQTYEGLPDKYTYTKGYHNILFNPYSPGENQLLGIGRHRIFTAHILPERMADLFSGYIPEFGFLAEKIKKSEPFVLHAPANAPANSLKRFFDSFWECPSSLSLRKLYFESKILDLLCRQVEVLVNDHVKGTTIPRSDLEKVYFVHEIILNNLYDPPSLPEFSKLSGLNEFKLKKYFKQVFNNSVFGILQEERLKAAKDMIYQGEKNISAIAYELGYAHPQHFQRAFKKRFGITPKALLK